MFFSSISPFRVAAGLKRVRKRAGIGQDLYLFATAAKGKEALREVIRNERRVELCFEDHRYWDLRRWGEIDKINTDVFGIEIAKETDSTFIYTRKIIESREFKSIYNPLPYEEVLRMKNLTQKQFLLIQHTILIKTTAK